MSSPDAKVDAVEADLARNRAEMADTLTEIDYYDAAPQNTQLPAILDECGKQVGVTIKHQQVPRAQFLPRLLQQASARSLPDLALVDNPDLQQLAATGGLVSLSKAGLSTVVLDRQHGGQGLTYAHAATVCEELSVASAAVGVSLITILQAQTMIGRFGRDSLKARYLPAFAEGLLSSYALTEAGHGSDIRQLDTKARRDGDDWVITGAGTLRSMASSTVHRPSPESAT